MPLPTLAFHCVFHTYRRRIVFVESIHTKADLLVQQIAKDKDMELICHAVMPDHVHLLLRLPAQEVSRAMNLFKGIMSRRVFQDFPDLKLDMHSNHLWAEGYFARTVDRASIPATIRYIQNQSHPPHDL